LPSGAGNHRRHSPLEFPKNILGKIYPEAIQRWIPCILPQGLRAIGHDGAGFAYDNEGPRHREFVAPFALASRPVTCGEYQAFIDDGGYRRPELWLSDG